MTGDKTLLEMGQEFLSHTKVRNRGFRDNCVFGFSLDDGKIATVGTTYCHGGVGWPRDFFDTEVKTPVGINTRIQFRSIGYSSNFGATHGGLLPEDYFEEYYDFLLNRSVFADCYVTKSTEGLREGGVVVVRCDRPANLVGAACVAIRRGWEYTSMSKSLINMIRMGIEPNLAHLVSYQVTVNSKGGYKGQKYSGHQSVYSQYFDKSGVENFRAGRLPPSSVYSTRLYSDIKRYQGLYGMWNESGAKAYVDNGRALRFRSREEVRSNVSDPFGLIARLPEKLGRGIMDVIEEGIRDL